jgi:hypothetical protein
MKQIIYGIFTLIEFWLMHIIFAENVFEGS